MRPSFTAQFRLFAPFWLRCWTRTAVTRWTSLAHVYEMSEALRSARSSVILPYETAKRDCLPDEIATNPNYIPEARLLGCQEFFGRFRAQKFVFVAEFGTEAAEPFDELWRIRKEIRWAVYVLLPPREINQGVLAVAARIKGRAAYMIWRGLAGSVSLLLAFM